jgi:hydroxylaminobenzene mutase
VLWRSTHGDFSLNGEGGRGRGRASRGMMNSVETMPATGATAKPAAAPQPIAVRHPLDPEPVRSTKAATVFALGLFAALTGIFVGGAVPAALALVLARQSKREAYEARGFLTGSIWLRRGERLAWIGIVLAITALVITMVIGLLRFADSPAGHDFGPNVN